MTDAQEPVAWAVVNPSGGTRFLGVKKEDAQKEATASERVAPVYWPAFTDAEREAVEVAARFMDKWGGVPNTIASDTLRGLLERHKEGGE